MDTNCEGLAHILGFVAQHESEFEFPTNRGRQGLLQLSTPTWEESAAAGELIHGSCDHLGADLAQPALA
jgi:hypothetical protein